MVTIERGLFGKTKTGVPVESFTLTNQHQLKVKITNFGGIITHILVPDREGKFDDVVLGYDTLTEYEDDTAYMGATIGRVANRISNTHISIGGHPYKLSKNLGNSQLHGGFHGFNKKVFEARIVHQNKLQLSYTSPDGEEGYPGRLKLSITYSLTNDNELHLAYQASTDKPTILNVSNHSYFNLKGAGNGLILDHEIQINAEKYTPVDDNMFPLGTVENVASTPYDFRNLLPINKPFGLTKNGFDINYVLRDRAYAARVVEPESGRTLQVFTDMPGLQFYTGNFLENRIGKAGKTYQNHGAFCLETQQFPDAVNCPAFPVTLLKPGDSVHFRTTYQFGTEKRGPSFG